MLKSALLPAAGIALMATAGPALAGYAEAMQALDAGEFETAAKEFEAFYDMMGDGYSAAHLGLMYEVGQGVPKDAEKAAYYLDLAATSDEIVEGQLTDYYCVAANDSCDVILTTEDGEEIGQCLAPECADWKALGKLPDDVAGKTVWAHLVITERKDPQGNFVAHDIGFGQFEEPY